MDLVDLIAEKKFLGQEFLTWLWYKSEERGGAIELDGRGDIQLVFEKHMLLETGVGDSHEKLICRGLQAELKEARTGLRMGKKIEQARIHMVQGEYEWHLTLSATLMEFRNVRPPETMSAADQELDGDAAVEGMVLDKLGMIQEAVHTVNGLFRLFLKQRISDGWQDELQSIRNWVARPAV